MYPYESDNPAVHGEEGRPDLTPEASRRLIASDPAVHGEDRNPNADPQIVGNIPRVVQEVRDAIDRETVALYEKAVSYAMAPDTPIGHEYDMPSIPPQNLGFSMLEAASETAKYYLEIGVDVYKQIESLKGSIEEDVEYFRSVQENSAETTRETSVQIQTEAAAREQGLAVIQTEIPLLDERRAALAGSNDGTRMATAVEKELMEMRTLSAAKQKELVAAFSWPPSGSGTTASTGWGPPTSVDAHTDPTELDPIEAERQRILNMPPPADLEDLFLAQEGLGHNISLYASPEAWWEAHKQERANKVRSYASGTRFAPGGMALVGEMGPELVNLPRGSQVIPNPRLGGDVHVHVNVEGSVVAERDLAQRLRQELIRTSRRTVDLGFN